MSVRFDDPVIRLEGECPIDDAEPLLALRTAHPAAAIDWSGCSYAHTAVLQLLLAGGVEVVGVPGGQQWYQMLGLNQD